VILGKNGHGGHKKGTIFKGALPLNMISQVLIAQNSYRYVGDIKGFRTAKRAVLYSSKT